MKPSAHAAAGIVLGAGALVVSRDAVVACAAAAAHVLLDVDHAVEHLLQSPLPFSVSTFLATENALTWKRLVFFLHGYEWVLLLWAACWLAPQPVLIAIAAGASSHLLLDEIGNRRPWAPVDLAPPFYFFFYRLVQGFLRSRLTRLRPNRTINGAPAPEVAGR